MSQAPVNDHCRCGLRVVELTSWTDENPGRRFLCCPHSMNGECRVFTWSDPPICARGRMVIPGLLRNINNREAENLKLRNKNKKLLKMLFVSWGFAAVLLVANLYKYSSFEDGHKDGGSSLVNKMLP